MRKSFKTALCTMLGVCIIAAVLAGCAQAGDQRALDPNNTGNGLDNGVENQGFYGNNLTGTRYGNNGYTGNTGYNGYTGNTDRNLTGRNSNTRNDPSNYLSYNGINTINYNNRFGRMGNTGTGSGNNNRTNGTTGMLTGNNGTNTANGNDTARATMIERQLESINGIDDCTVIVSGDTALVGLRTNRVGTGNMSRLRASIEQRVRQMDSSIRNVRVTDSPNMLTRMGRLGTTGNSNGMANNFMQEFNNMINSLNNAGR